MGIQQIVELKNRNHGVFTNSRFEKIKKDGYTMNSRFAE